MRLVIDLPLPLSKNVVKESKTYYDRRAGRTVNRMITSDEVYFYRVEVNRLIGKIRPMSEFSQKTKTILNCTWRKPSNRWDCSNWHQELCDAVAPALGLNDRYFLVRDVDYTVDKKNPGVLVEIVQA